MGAIALAGHFSTFAQTLAEALDTTNLVWTTGGDANWFAQTTNTHDGFDAIRSGVVGSNETSWIETTVVGPSTVSFWTFTSPNSYIQNYSFTVNGEAPSYQEWTISGDWGEQFYDLAAGTNVLRWAISTNAPSSPAPPPPPPGLANTGFVALDQFTISNPRPLAFLWQSSDQTVYPGDWAYVQAMAVGTPPLHYQWQRGGTNLAEETNNFIIFYPFTTNDAGVYSVIVSNSQGVIVSSNATLSILPPTAPTFYYQPESLTAYTGQQLTFHPGVSGSPPFYYQWRKDGTNILGANGTNNGGYGGGYGGGPTISLSFSPVSLADAGNYTVVVSNSVDSIESSNATLTVLQSVLPVITRHPRSLEVATGVNTWLSSAATGTPDPNFKWTRVGDLPPPPPDPTFPPFPPTEIEFGASSTKQFYNIPPTNAGVYFVTASNCAGAVVSRDALLTVLPSITNLGSWPEGANDIFVTNGRAYLAQDTNGLAILDVSNPASPQLLGRYDTPGHAMRVQVSGGLAFVADDAAGVQIINVTNPANPILVGTYNTTGYAHDIAVRSNLVFVADNEAGLLVLSITNPAAPSVVGKFTNNFSASRISLSENFAILSSISHVHVNGQTNIQFGGLLVLDISNPAQPVQVGRYGTSFMASIGRMPFLFASTDGFGTIYSLSNASPPSVIGRFDFFHAYDMALAGDRLYAVGEFTNSGLYVLDVRDPTEPIPVGYFVLPDGVGSLAVDGQRVYVTGYNAPLRILEVPFHSMPDSPPTLSLSKQGGLKLQIQGRLGLHYTVESAAELTDFLWQPLWTLLLTNDTAVLDVPASTGTMFFRAKRLD